MKGRFDYFLAKMLYGLKGAPGFLSGDPIFAQRVDQPVDEEAVKRFVQAMRGA